MVTSLYLGLALIDLTCHIESRRDLNLGTVGSGSKV